jgi:peptide/nickel transport system ATP-binding protein
VGLPQAELRAFRGAQIAMIFQDPMTALTPVYTIGWQIVEQIRAHESVSRRSARRRALELLGEVGIPNPAVQFDRFPHQLSGGTRQRAVIAMALSCHPAVLVADEPTTALDVTVQAQILDLLRRLRSDFGSAVVLITHDMGVVAELADRVVVMYAGRIIECGRTSELFQDAWHPYTWGLLASIPPLRGKRPERLRAIPGMPPSPLDRASGCSFAPRCSCRFERCSERPRSLDASSREAACFIPAEERTVARQRSLSEAEGMS